MKIYTFSTIICINIHGFLAFPTASGFGVLTNWRKFKSVARYCCVLSTSRHRNAVFLSKLTSSARIEIQMRLKLCRFSHETTFHLSRKRIYPSMIHLIRDLNKKIIRGFSRFASSPTFPAALKHFLITLWGEKRRESDEWIFSYLHFSWLFELFSRMLAERAGWEWWSKP